MTLVQSQPLQSLAPLRWTRSEYYQLAEEGYFHGKRVMLIDGEIIQMPGQKEPHAWTITLLNRMLVQRFDPQFVVRCQLPLDISDYSEPEPDFALVDGPLERWRSQPHPETAHWIIEVSDTTLTFDQTVKQSLYAAGGVPEYWAVNLVDRRIEVYQDPMKDPSARFGWRYQSTKLYGPDGKVSPRLKPDAIIQVNDILP